MNGDNKIPEKPYFNLREVSELTGVQENVLRYWESEFPMLAPEKDFAGHRLYGKHDVAMVARIKKLIDDEQYTIDRVKKKLLAELPEDSQSNPARILIADDDLAMLYLLRDYLKKLGYEVFTAQNGRELLDKAQQKKPDLIILDVTMPEINGLDACRQLKNDDATREIAIIFLSASDETATKIHAFSVGASDFLGKPFSPRELEARIAATLRSKQFKEVKGQTAKRLRSSSRKDTDPYRLTGSVIADKYELVEYAGVGGMGVVYRATDLNDESTIAIKILKPDVANKHPEYVELFEEEVKTAQRLNHPHIVKVLDGGNAEHVFMAMEWIEGKSIEDVVAQEKLSLERISNIFEQTCSAVASAHQKNVIHLDIKPGNILLLHDRLPNDFVKVIDFGLSKIISRESGMLVTHFRGTHQFCAPEQFGGKISYRSDIYSLGATLYHLISGVVPFGTSYINAKMHANLELPELSSLTNYMELPVEVDQIISKALSRNPKSRHDSARQLFEDFSAAIKSGTSRANQQKDSVEPESL
jgi:DNA-binding response OmpR family regulator